MTKNVGVLYRASKNLNFHCLKQLYFSLIHSHINYGNIVWASCYKTKTNKIFIKQKQAIRIVFRKDRYSSAGPLMLDLNALNVYQLNIFHILQFMHKVKYNLVPEVFRDQFSFIHHNYPTRFSKFNNRTPKPSTTPKFSILSRGPKLFNCILNDTEKCINNVKVFKKQIKSKVISITSVNRFF